MHVLCIFSLHCWRERSLLITCTSTSLFNFCTKALFSRHGFRQLTFNQIINHTHKVPPGTYCNYFVTFLILDVAFFGTMVYCTRMNLKSIPYCSWGTQCDWPIKKRGWVIQSKCNKVFFCSENQNKASSLHHCLELHLKNHMPLWDRMVIIVLILYGPILWLNNSANGITDFPFLSVSPSLPPHSSIVLYFLSFFLHWTGPEAGSYTNGPIRPFWVV